MNDPRPALISLVMFVALAGGGLVLLRSCGEPSRPVEKPRPERPAPPKADPEEERQRSFKEAFTKWKEAGFALQDERVTSSEMSTVWKAPHGMTDAGLKALPPIPNGIAIDLGETQVTAAGLKHLAGTQRIVCLKLKPEQVTDEVLATLAGSGLIHTLYPTLPPTVIRSSISNDYGHRPPRAYPSSLLLGGTRVTAAGLKHLAALPNLASLSLSGAPVTDDGFEAVASLKGLTTLYLNGTKVTAAGLKHLAGLNRLAALHLDPAQITNEVLRVLSEAKLLHTLEQARIDKNEYERPAGPAEVARLDLGGTAVTDAGLKHVADFANLTSLDLSRTGVTGAGLKGLAAIGKLSTLGLSRTGVTDDTLAHVAEFKSLAKLDLSNTKVTDGGLAHLARLRPLTALTVSGTEVTAEGVKHLVGLKNLSSVEIDHERVTDRFLEVLAESGRLDLLAGGKPEEVTSLDLSNTSVTAAGLKHLTAFGRLATLRLSEAQMTGAGLKSLGKLKPFPSLGLSDDRVTDGVLAALAESGLLHLLPNAKGPDGKPATKPEVILRLSLTKTKVTGAGLKSLATLRNLAELGLSDAQVTDDALKALAAAGQLHALPGALAPGGKRPVKPEDVVILSLKGTGVTNEGVVHLAALKNLNSLDLEKTAVTEAGAAKLRKLLPKCKIDTDP